MSDANSFKPSQGWVSLPEHPVGTPMSQSRELLLKLRSSLQQQLEKNTADLERERVRLARLRNGGGS